MTEVLINKSISKRFGSGKALPYTVNCQDIIFYNNHLGIIEVQQFQFLHALISTNFTDLSLF